MRAFRILTFAAAFAVPAAAVAHSPGGGHLPPPAPPSRPAASQPKAPATPIPDTYGGIVSALRDREKAANTLLDAGQLHYMGPVTRAMVDLAVALPDKASTLPEDQRTALALHARDLKEQAEWLQEKSDRGDVVATRTAVNAVTALIDSLSTFAN